MLSLGYCFSIETVILSIIYKDVVGEPFDWLYLDFNTLVYYAENNGFNAEVVAEGEHYDYLARLTVA